MENLARQFPHTFAGLWFSLAALIPTAFVFVIAIGFFKSRIQGFELDRDITGLFLLPPIFAAIFGSTIGSGIISSSKKESWVRAILRGLAISLLSFLVYLLVVTHFLRGAFDFFGTFFTILIYASIVVGWLVVFVGIGASLILYILVNHCNEKYLAQIEPRLTTNAPDPQHRPSSSIILAGGCSALCFWIAKSNYERFL
jgi:hypothetical protein